MSQVGCRSKCPRQVGHVSGKKEAVGVSVAGGVTEGEPQTEVWEGMEGESAQGIQTRAVWD